MAAGFITSTVLSFFLKNPDAKPREAAAALGLKVTQVYSATYRLRQRGDIQKVKAKQKALKLKQWRRKIVKTSTSKNRPKGKKRLFAITWETNTIDREFHLVQSIENKFDIHLENYNYSQKFTKLTKHANPKWPKITVGTE